MTYGKPEAAAAVDSCALREYQRMTEKRMITERKDDADPDICCNEFRSAHSANRLPMGCSQLVKGV
jgi:hypothetical protein